MLIRTIHILRIIGTNGYHLARSRLTLQAPSMLASFLVVIAFVLQGVSCFAADTTSTIAVVGSFPSRSQRMVLEQLTKTGKMTSFPYTFESVFTYGSMEDRAGARENGQIPSAAVYLDAASFAALGALYQNRIVVVPTFMALKTNGQQSGHVRTIIIETMPRGSDISRAISKVRPLANLGIIYTKGLSVHTEVLSELKKELLGKSQGICFRECAFPPGACQNLLTIQSVLRENLSDLSSGSLLLVLSDTNQTKFFFAIEQFSAQNHFALIPTGDLPGELAAISISRAPEDLAALCLKNLENLIGGRSSGNSLQVNVPPRVVYNKQLLSNLGYSLLIGK